MKQKIFFFVFCIFGVTVTQMASEKVVLQKADSTQVEKNSADDFFEHFWGKLQGPGEKIQETSMQVVIEVLLCDSDEPFMQKSELKSEEDTKK